MKKKYILIILLLIFTVGCQNKKIEDTNVEEQVSKKIEEVNNITVDSILASYEEIKNQIEDKLDQKTYDELKYNAVYLNKIATYDDKNYLYLLSETTLTYLKSQNSKNLNEVTKLFKVIERHKVQYATSVYNNYHIIITVKKIREEQTPIVKADINDSNIVNIKTITKAVDYIKKNIDNPLNNNETIEKMVYYSMFLKELGPRNNNLTLLGKYTLDYLSTLDTTNKSKAKSYLKIVSKNLSNVIELYYNESTKK